MSQDEPSRSRRRESILKQRQVVEVEEEQVVVVGGKNKRRVSFRNVKEVQFFNRDKNCPELLHDAAPIREKINETLGSDGIMSPGRSVHSHSSKNNTLDMFGDGARKPVPTVPEQEVQKFVVTENRMNATSHSCVDMSIADDTQDGDSTLQMFNKTTANASMDGDGLNETMAAFKPARNGADITMQMFTKKAVTTAPREHSPMDPEPVAMDISIANNSANDTMLAFRSAKTASVSPPLNETMDMFQNQQRSGQQHHEDLLNKTSHSPVPMEISMDVTQARRVLDAGPSDMNITMEMFTKPAPGAGLQKTPNGKELEEKRQTPRLHLSPVVNKDLDDTFALFGGAKKTNESVRQEPVGDLNGTFAMFAGAQQKPEEPSKPATPAAVGGHNATMSLFEEKKTANATMALFDEEVIKSSAQKRKKSNETMALFEEKKATPTRYDETLVLFKETNEVVIEETNNDTFNLFSGANQNTQRERAGHDANGTMSIFPGGLENQTMNQSDMDISTATALGMDNTHLIFTAARASDSSSQERELEEERKMDVSIVSSAGIAPIVVQQERLTEHKTPEAAMVHNVSDMDMDITSATIANVSSTSSANGERTLRASILSQSLRSRRRSSLGSTIREMSFTDSPTLRVDPNSSLQEQLSFIYRNTLFDAKTTRIAYLELVEGQTEANKLRALAAKKLNDIVEEKIAGLSEEKKRALREVSDKCPDKFTAVENLNPRLLSPLDRDIMNASLARAEEQWWEVRKQFATQFTKEVKEQRLAIGKELKKAQEDALLCEEINDLESKYALLEKEMNELDDIDMEELEKLDEEEAKLQRMLEEQELTRKREKNEKLRRELEFVLQEIEDKKVIAKLLQAEIAETEAKEEAVLALLNGPSPGANQSQ